MPTFLLELKFDDRGAVTGVQRLNQIGSAAANTKREVRELEDTLKRTARGVLALVGAYRAAGAVKDFARCGSAACRVAVERQHDSLLLAGIVCTCNIGYIACAGDRDMGQPPDAILTVTVG